MGDNTVEIFGKQNLPQNISYVSLGLCSIYIKCQVQGIYSFLALDIFPILVSANTVFHLDSYSLAYTSDSGPLGVLCYKQWIQNYLLKFFTPSIPTFSSW